EEAEPPRSPPARARTDAAHQRRRCSPGASRQGGDVVLGYPAALPVLVDTPEPAAFSGFDAEDFADVGGEFDGGVVDAGKGCLIAGLDVVLGHPAAFAAWVGTPDPDPGGVVVPVVDFSAGGEG